MTRVRTANVNPEAMPVPGDPSPAGFCRAVAAWERWGADDPRCELVQRAAPEALHWLASQGSWLQSAQRCYERGEVPASYLVATRRQQERDLERRLSSALGLGIGAFILQRAAWLVVKLLVQRLLRWALSADDATQQYCRAVRTALRAG